MKRPAMTISGRAVSPSELRTEVKEAYLAWLRYNRESKATKKRLRSSVKFFGSPAMVTAMAR